MAANQNPNEAQKQELVNPAPFQEVPEHVAQEHLAIIKAGAKRVDENFLEGKTPEQIQREKDTGKLFTSDEELLNKLRNPEAHQKKVLRATLDSNGDGIVNNKDEGHENFLKNIENGTASAREPGKEIIKKDINYAAKKIIGDLEAKTGLVISDETKEEIKTALLKGANKSADLTKNPAITADREGLKEEKEKDKQASKGSEEKTMLAMIISLIASLFNANQEEKDHAKADIEKEKKPNVNFAKESFEKVTGRDSKLDFQRENLKEVAKDGYASLKDMTESARLAAVDAAKGVIKLNNPDDRQSAPLFVAKQQEVTGGRTA